MKLRERLRLFRAAGTWPNITLEEFAQQMDSAFDGGQTRAGVPMGPANAMAISAFFCGINLIMGAIASMPCLLYRRTGAQSRERYTDHPLYGVLHDQVGPYMTAHQWKRAMTGRIVLWGNAYAIMLRDPYRGFVTGCERILDSSQVKVAQDKKTRRLFYEITYGPGEKETLTREDAPRFIFHVPGPGFNGVTGFTLLSLARESLGLTAGMEQFGQQYFGKGVHASGFLERPLEAPKLATPEARKRLVESIIEQYAGLSNQGKLVLLEEGTKFNRNTIPLEDAQFLLSRTFQIEEVARWLNLSPARLKDLSRATFCLPAGTEIATESGPVAIEEIAIGTRVWSKGGIEWVMSRVSRMECTGEDPILTIKTTNRTLRANAKHRILVRRRIASTEKGLNGHQIIAWGNEYIPAGELKVGDTIICMDRLPSEGSRKAPTREASIGFMEFCGLLLGDGNVYPKWGVSIARAESAAYMDYYRKIMSAEFKSYDGCNGKAIDAESRTAPVRLIEGERQTKFASVLAATELQKLGLCGTAHTKKVPSWVFGLSEEFRLAFLRGFLDADGSVDKKGRISYSSCNGMMLSQIKYLCISCGIPVTNLRCQRGMTTLPNGECAKYAQWSFTCSDPGANRRIGSQDPRYRKRLSDGQPFGRKSRAYPRHGGREFDIPGCSLSRVSSIIVSPAEPVYDLTIEDTHNFVAEGVLVHNSNIEQLQIMDLQDCFMPWASLFEAEIHMQLVEASIRQKVFPEFLMDALLRADSVAQANALAIERQWGITSADEWRAMKNRNPQPNGQGEKYLVPSNYTVADKIGEAPKDPVFQPTAPQPSEKPPGDGTQDEK